MRHAPGAAPLHLLPALLCVLLVLMPALARAAPALHLSADASRLSLEGRLEHFVDSGGTLPFEAVAQPDFIREHFVRLPGFRSLGYNTDVHWFHVTLEAKPEAPPRWVLAIGTPELDALDVWVQQREGGYQQHRMGYTRPFENRPLRTRLFALPIETFPGMQVFLRVRSNNAVSVHAELWQVDAYTAHETRSNFYRGGYFGILLIAVAFYLILGARLRDGVMLSYAGYIAGQLLFLLGTNGYLPVLTGADSGGALTDAVQRIGWLGAAMCILLMWDRLLELKHRHPWIHRLFLFSVVFNLGFLPFALWPALVGEGVLYAVELANVLGVLNFVISMALLLLQWSRSRRTELLVYFVAFVIPALGTAINSGADLGQLPWNAVTASFLQWATLVHVLVMSYGLALRLRQLQFDKAAAEQEAAVATQRSEEQRRFVAMLSHEFGNPLAAIDRAAQMLQIKMPELAAAHAQRLAHIRSNAATLSGFVDNFLMTEALDHGALALSREPCHVRELLERCIHVQGDPANERIRLRDCPAITFDLDPTFIGIALGNLLTNALRYSPPQSPVEVDATRDDKGLLIRITDHGPGMSDEELDKLGTPYFRAASSLGKKGSGLGYHFTRRIVEAHGGSLSTARRDRAGLTVEIFLPA